MAYEAGRTWAEAAKAGDFFGLREVGGAWTFNPPACDSAEEVMAYARKRFPYMRGREVFIVRHLPSSSMCGNVVAVLGTVTL